MAQSTNHKGVDTSHGREGHKSSSDGYVYQYSTQANNLFKRGKKKKKKRSQPSTDGYTPPLRELYPPHGKNDFIQQSRFISLPLEVLLKILSEYTLSARDLINLSLSCKHFSAAILSGLSLVEEAARLNTYRVLSSCIPEALHRIQAETGPRQQQIAPIPRYRDESWLQVYHHVHNMFVRTMDSGTMCCAGGSHTAVVKDGELYTFGLGKNGQLGLGSRSDVLDPTQVNIQPYGRDYKRRGLRVERVRVRSVSCGLLHSAAVSAGGVLYTCGLNRRGELGYSVSRDDDTEEQGSVSVL